jgi:type VI secretion system protein VasD
MKKIMRMAFAIAFIFFALCLSSCGSSKVKVALSSDTKLNPDINHQSLPVVARLYQLKDKQKFEAANFHLLWKDEIKTLGTDLVSKEEILIYPGDKKTITLQRHEEAEFVAVVALFRDYKQGEWRVIQPISRKITLQLENNQLKLAGKSA